MELNSQRVLLIENYASDFYYARVPFAKYLLNNGYSVFALIPDTETFYIKKIKECGISVYTYQFNRKNKNIFQLISLLRIFNLFIRENEIDIIHSFRFQPNLINVLSNLFNKKKVVLHVTGLGIAYSNASFPYLLLRIVSQMIFTIKLFRADKVIVQNEEDKNDITFSRIWRNKIFVVCGSGINTDIFNKDHYNKSAIRDANNINQKDFIFICITRLIWEKGIKELVDAFLELSKTKKDIKLWIVGWIDEDNPRHISAKYINQFVNHHCIYFTGKKNNIAELLALSDVFIYPSYYREGIPRSILEAMAMSLPIITTDMPGCNLTVISNYNGELIETRSSKAIINCVKCIIENNDLLAMGKRSRQMAENKFKDTLIYSQINEIYNQ